MLLTICTRNFTYVSHCLFMLLQVMYCTNVVETKYQILRSTLASVPPRSLDYETEGSGSSQRKHVYGSASNERLVQLTHSITAFPCQQPLMFDEAGC